MVLCGHGGQGGEQCGEMSGDAVGREAREAVKRMRVGCGMHNSVMEAVAVTSGGHP